MRSVRTIVLTSLFVLGFSFASMPANAANRVINGDFETCDLTGWEFAPSENADASSPIVSAPIATIYTLPATGVYNVIGIDGCSFVELDQAVIQQEFEILPGESFVVSFDALLIPGVSDLNQAWIISDPCEIEDGREFPEELNTTMYGRVGIDWLFYDELLQNRTLGSTLFDVRQSGTDGGAAVPVLGATHARVKVSACSALGGVIFDNIVVDTA